MRIYWDKDVVQVKPQTDKEMKALMALVEFLDTIKFGYVEPIGPGQG